MEVAGIPLIIVGRSGENVDRTDIQVWEKVIGLGKEEPTRMLWEEGRWLVCVLLSILFVLENILVCAFFYLQITVLNFRSKYLSYIIVVSGCC